MTDNHHFNLCINIMGFRLFTIPFLGLAFLFFIFQATIGIDFLSKTMYLEDRTVSIVQHGQYKCGGGGAKIHEGQG